MAVWTMVLISLATVCAQDPAAPDPQQQSMEIRRKFSELSRKVNELPELKRLKAEVEKAQQAYTAAFEAAMAKEDPQILAKYRSLFEARIERLQGKKQVSPPTTVDSSATALSDTDRKRLTDAQRAAMAVPSVREALQRWNVAQTDEARDAAKAEYLEVLRKAMIEADPGLRAMLLETDGASEAKPSTSPAK